MLMFAIQFMDTNGVLHQEHQTLAQQEVHSHVTLLIKEIHMFLAVRLIIIIIGAILQHLQVAVLQQDHSHVCLEIKAQVTFQVVHQLLTHVVTVDILKLIIVIVINIKRKILLPFYIDKIQIK